ncbi:hypothetical protein NKG05_15615 [Oerskovia sp. M15]
MVPWRAACAAPPSRASRRSPPSCWPRAAHRSRTSRPPDDGAHLGLVGRARRARRAGRPRRVRVLETGERAAVDPTTFPTGPTTATFADTVIHPIVGAPSRPCP